MKVTQLAENGWEEFIETGLDECLISEMQGFINKFQNEEGNCAMMAGASMATAIGQGITMYISWKVSELLVEGMIKRAGAYWAYINMGKLKKYLNDKFKNVSILGKSGSFILKNILLSDTTGNRIETMKLAQSEINRFDTHTHQHQSFMGQNLQTLEQKKDKLLKVKDSKKTQNIEAFRHKTLTMTWTSSIFDKRIFESVTGLKIKSTGKGIWSKTYKDLNNYSEFAKDLEGNLINVSTALVKTLNSKGRV